MSGFAEMHRYDGLGLAELVRRREVSPLDLVEASIQRIEALNPALNAVVHKMYDTARRRAQSPLGDGPFAGVPMLLKDLLIAYAGEPLRNGSRCYRDHVPAEDSELVRRYKRAGLVVVGKTNTSELGITGVTEPALFGPTCNPWELSRTVGGSSGGSAAAVAARLVPLAHGGDGGGSIRIPAACCGVVGLKPTRGRTPGSTPFTMRQDLVVEHALTRSVRDCAALLDATAGPVPGSMNTPPPPARPYLEEVGAPAGRLRVGFTDGALLGRNVHPACIGAVEDTVGLLEELGHEPVPVGLEHIDWRAFARAYITMLGSEVRADIEEAERQLGRQAAYGEFELVTRALGLLGRHSRGSDVVHAIRTLQRIGAQIGEYFAQQRLDVLLTSTLASPPVPIGSVLPRGFDELALKALVRLRLAPLIHLAGVDEKVAAESFEFTPNTTPFNLTGQPAMSLPLAWTDDGLPVGVQLVGRFADESTLFRLAGQLEEARPWAQRIPPLAAQPDHLSRRRQA